MRRRVGLSVLVGLALFGCQPAKRVESAPGRPPAADALKVAAGTRVRIVLLEGLEAGAAKPGQAFAAAVAEDLVVLGRTVLPKGTPVRGIVVASRGGSTANQLLNRPARLSVRFEAATAADGFAAIELVPLDSANDIALTRKNTGTVEAAESGGGEKGSEAIPVEPALEALALRALGGDREAVAELEAAVVGPELPQVRDLAQAKRLSEVPDWLAAVRSGAAGTGVAPTALAALELANFVSRGASKLERQLRAPTIRAFPGTVLEVETPEDVIVMLAPNR